VAISFQLFNVAPGVEPFVVGVGITATLALACGSVTRKVELANDVSAVLIMLSIPYSEKPRKRGISYKFEIP
jgi:hypothetical protein